MFCSAQDALPSSWQRSAVSNRATVLRFTRHGVGRAAATSGCLLGRDLEHAIALPAAAI